MGELQCSAGLELCWTMTLSVDKRQACIVNMVGLSPTTQFQINRVHSAFSGYMYQCVLERRKPSCSIDQYTDVNNTDVA